MRLQIDVEWFERMAAKESDLEIGAGRRFPPAYDGCRCACHSGYMLHVVACCHPSKEELQELRRCLEIETASTPTDERLRIVD